MKNVHTRGHVCGRLCGFSCVCFSGILSLALFSLSLSRLPFRFTTHITPSLTLAVFLSFFLCLCACVCVCVCVYSYSRRRVG